mmetsp:Transcript_19952/g.56261  ORF Transcript_19952/g.56261 Transcript_19952/m.56261 type:complete len:271 (-) Transcript_19952:1009-1821(-)
MSAIAATPFAFKSSIPVSPRDSSCVMLASRSSVLSRPAFASSASSAALQAASWPSMSRNFTSAFARSLSNCTRSCTATASCEDASSEPPRSTKAFTRVCATGIPRSPWSTPAACFKRPWPKLAELVIKSETHPVSVMILMPMKSKCNMQMMRAASTVIKALQYASDATVAAFGWNAMRPGMNVQPITSTKFQRIVISHRGEPAPVILYQMDFRTLSSTRRACCSSTELQTKSSRISERPISSDAPSGLAAFSLSCMASALAVRSFLPLLI